MQELIKVAPNGAKTGAAVLTGGHDLKQQYVIHTPGPVWKGGGSKEAEKLASCYRSCLEVADGARITSLAFCSIATGIYGYPLDQAAPLAVRTVLDYLTAHPDTPLTRIGFAMYQQPEYDAFTKALADASGSPRIGGGGADEAEQISGGNDT